MKLHPRDLRRTILLPKGALLWDKIGRLSVPLHEWKYRLNVPRPSDHELARLKDEHAATMRALRRLRDQHARPVLVPFRRPVGRTPAPRRVVARRAAASTSRGSPASGDDEGGSGEPDPPSAVERRCWIAAARAVVSCPDRPLGEQLAFAAIRLLREGAL